MRFQHESRCFRRIPCAAFVAALLFLLAVPGFARANPGPPEPPSPVPYPRGPLTLEGAAGFESAPAFAYGRVAPRIPFHTKAGLGWLELAGLMGEGPADDGAYGRVEGRLALAGQRSAAWLGVAAQRDADRKENSLPLFGLGAQSRVGAFAPSVGVQQTPDHVTRYDYQYSVADTGWVAIGHTSAIRRTTMHTGIGWSHGRVALESLAGISLSPAAAPRTWLRASASMALVPGLALVATGGSGAPALFGSPESKQGQATLGLRMTPAWGGAPASGTSGDGPAWHVFHEDNAWYRMEVRVANARSVEITSDATQWVPRALDRVAKDRWRLRLELAPGVYHVNLRIDGGPWVVPPGAPTATDEFVGATGVLVVQK